VLVGHFPREGRGAEDDYAIHGNFFYQNRHEALFQGEGNVALYGNLFVNDYGDAVRIQPHNDIPRLLTVAFNTVLARGAGIVVAQKPGSPRFRQDVFANAVFAGVPLAGAQGPRNLGAPLDEAPTYLRRPFAPPGELDLRPSWDWAATLAAAALPDTPLPDRDQDFDGRARAPNAVGAYTGGDAERRWFPGLERKPDAGRERPGS
jgi:hypothetical protein